MLKDYFWRNTKESVKEELTIPDTVDEVKFVELSNIERAIYMGLHDQHGTNFQIIIWLALLTFIVTEYSQLESCSFNHSRNNLRQLMINSITNLTVKPSHYCFGRI